MNSTSRRDFLSLGLATCAGVADGAAARPAQANVHQQLLDLAARQQERRRARFATVRTKEELERLQKSLRRAFLGLLDGLPVASGPPPVKKIGRIEGDGY